SATMMNKGLELIEAHHLFGLPESQIDIVVHPQSVIHSLVAYTDGSVLAQLGSPDMRTPIAYALGWPKRIPTPAKRLDLAAIGSLTFENPDSVRFPALRLAREALKAGGTAPAVLNAANEVAVAAFLKGKIGFLHIAQTVQPTLPSSRFPSSRWRRSIPCVRSMLPHANAPSSICGETRSASRTDRRRAARRTSASVCGFANKNSGVRAEHWSFL